MNNSRWLLLIMVKWLPTIIKVKLVNRLIYWQDSHLKQDKLCHSLITMRLVKIVAIWQIQWLSDIVPLSLFYTDVNNEVAILRVCHTNTVQTHTLNTIKVRCKYYTSTVKILYKCHANSGEKNPLRTILYMSILHVHLLYKTRWQFCESVIRRLHHDDTRPLLTSRLQNDPTRYPFTPRRPFRWQICSNS